MRFFETAKLAAGIDLGKKLLGGRKKAAVQQERSAFFRLFPKFGRVRVFEGYQRVFERAQETLTFW